MRDDKAYGPNHVALMRKLRPFMRTLSEEANALMKKLTEAAGDGDLDIELLLSDI